MTLSEKQCEHNRSKLYDAIDAKASRSVLMWVIGLLFPVMIGMTGITLWAYNGQVVNGHAVRAMQRDCDRKASAENEFRAYVRNKLDDITKRLYEHKELKP